MSPSAPTNPILQRSHTIISLSVEVKEKVELYLYSSLGLHDLFWEELYLVLPHMFENSVPLSQRNNSSLSSGHVIPPSIFPSVLCFKRQFLR